MIFLGSRMCLEFLLKLFSLLNPPSQRRKSRKTRSRIQKLLQGNYARKSIERKYFKSLNSYAVEFAISKGFLDIF